jgi:hypothetical protein
VREKSHINDMRSAIRGDFERLAERRGGQELMREPAEHEEPTPESEHVAEQRELVSDEPAVEATEPDDAVEALVTREPEPEPEPSESPVDEAPLPEEALPEEAQAEEPRRRSWLDRLLGR